MDKCGSCLNRKPCDKQTGHCTEGCQSHFKRPFCQGNVVKRWDKNKKNEDFYWWLKGLRPFK